MALLVPLNAGLQLPVEQGSIMSLQVGVDNHGFVHHPASVRPAVAALHLVQARHLFQAQHVLKALLEVVRQEGVQDGVGAAVGVTEHHHEVERALHDGGGVYRASDRGDVKNVERQPAQDKYCDHDGHHPGHLTLRTFALRGTNTHSRRFHLPDGKKKSGDKHKNTCCMLTFDLNFEPNIKVKPVI